MSNSLKTQKRLFYSRAVAGLVVIALAAACDSPTRPSRNPIEPSQSQTEPSRDGPLPSPPTGDWPDVSGTYTLTVSASSRCASELPEAARTRTFTVTIAQTGGALVVTRVPSFMSVWMEWIFKGELDETNDVIFQLSIEDWGLLAQAIEDFYATGSLTATISAGGLSGLLDGYIRGFLANEDGRGYRDVTCTAPDHSVVFSR
jgi:hypothetical protein